MHALALALVVALAPPTHEAVAPSTEEVAAIAFERMGDGHALVLEHHRLRATFDDGRTTIGALDGSWSTEWSLEARGRRGSTVEAQQPLGTTANDARIAFERPEATEWWRVRGGALEHGFTVHARPTGEGELMFALDIDGDGAPRIDADARGAVLCDGSGRVLFEYRGLVAFDADGDALPARMERSTNGLDLVVDDRGADYPITIDPVVRTAYLKAPALGQEDFFGTSVAMDGDTIVVGAPDEDSNATGINGDPNNDLATDTGAAYVFRRNGGAWSQEAYVKAAVTSTDDQFGAQVAIDGNLMVVAAPWESSDATGANGDPNNDDEPFSGAAYVFARLGSTWTQRVFLKASNTDEMDGFGGAVAISGDRIAIGAPYEDSSATGINGNQNDESGVNSGAVYVFRLQGGTFVQEAYIKASNTGFDDRFGFSLDMDGDTLVVGAIGEASIAMGVNGFQGNDHYSQAGAAYVFVRNGTTWSQQAYLKASNTGPGDFFGWDVAIDGDTLVVGAPHESSIASGIDGDGANDFQGQSGAAYVFARNGTTWSQQAYVKSSNPDLLDRFGSRLAIDGDLLVVGSALEGSGANGIDGNQVDNSETDAGAAYLFVRHGTTWSQRAYIKAPNSGDNQHFGSAVDIAGDDVVIGEPWENGATTGIGGDPFATGVIRSGAVHVFDAGLWAQLPGCAGNPAELLPPAGSVSIGSATALSIHTSALPTGIAATYVGAPGIDTGGCGTPLLGGGEALLAFAPLPMLVGLAPVASGAATQPLAIPNLAALAGQHLTFQSAAIDAVTFASELSNGLEIEVLP